jgi:hypothetical protein
VSSGENRIQLEEGHLPCIVTIFDRRQKLKSASCNPILNLIREQDYLQRRVENGSRCPVLDSTSPTDIVSFNLSVS